MGDRQPFAEHGPGHSVIGRPTPWGWCLRLYTRVRPGPGLQLTQTAYTWTRWGAERKARRWVR